MNPVSKQSATRPPRAVPAWLPYAILAAAAAFLVSRWESLPSRWPSHWGAGSVANGWSERTIAGVLGLLALALPVLVLLEILAAAERAWIARRPELAPLAWATSQLLRLIACGVSCFVAFLAIFLPLRASMSLPSVGVAVALFLLAPTVFGMAGIAREMNRLRDVGVIGEGYQGMVYRNPKDPRLWVPNLIGPGITINFAHRWAWPMMLAVVLVSLALAAFIFASVTHR